MIFSLSILSILIIFVRSPLTLYGDILRTDCYEAFAYPIIRINVLNFNPSGPPYLFSTFHYTRYSTLPSNQVKTGFASFHFKKLNESCAGSALFTATGYDFEKMDIRITLHLAEYRHQIALIKYTLYRGFSAGIYELFSNDKNFAVELEIRDVEGEYLSVHSSSDDLVKSFLRSLSLKKDYLCIITGNNRAVVINSHDAFTRSPGLVVGLQAVIVRDEQIIGFRDYPAFECNEYDQYSDEPVVFITDGKKYKIKFRVLYWKYFNDNFISFSSEFTLPNAKFNYVGKLKKIPEKYKKVFLIRLKSYVKQCSDKSHVTEYFSEDHTTYLVEFHERVNITANVEISRKTYRSPLDPCKRNN